jgi:hypothetical protein
MVEIPIAVRDFFVSPGCALDWQMDVIRKGFKNFFT